MIRTLLKPLSFLPALLLMYMIYSFSAQPGEVSSQLSYKVSYKIVKTVDYVFDGGHEDWQIAQWADKINFITRKLAHMTEYFALAVAVSFPLYVYGLHGFLLMLVAGIICVGFACGDEYHQSFVAGRSPAVKDVCIDSVGVFFGIILVRIVGWTGRKTIFRPRKKKKKFQNKAKEFNPNEEYPYGESDAYDTYGKAPYGGPGGYPPPPAYGSYPPRNGYSPQDGYSAQNGYDPQGGYSAQNGYSPQGGYSAQNGYGPQGNYPPPAGPYYGNNSFEEYDSGEAASGKKKKKEKDWLFDDFV